jgi:hypothetical protein
MTKRLPSSPDDTSGSSWFEVLAAAPEFAATVEARFTAHPHHVIATLHADGRPRVNGTNVLVTEGRLWVGTMPGAARAVDLARRGWCALHSAPLDPELGRGSGDARIEARAVPIEFDEALPMLDLAFPEGNRPDEGEFFELLVTSMSLVELEVDHLVITQWSPTTGVLVTERA